SRFGKWCRPFLGTCAGHQATNPAGNLWAAADVVPGSESFAVSLHRRWQRNSFNVHPSRPGSNFGPTSRRNAPRMGALGRPNSATGGKEGDGAQVGATRVWDSVAVTRGPVPKVFGKRGRNYLSLPFAAQRDRQPTQVSVPQTTQSA